MSSIKCQNNENVHHHFTDQLNNYSIIRYDFLSTSNGLIIKLFSSNLVCAFITPLVFQTGRIRETAKLMYWKTQYRTAGLISNKCRISDRKQLPHVCSLFLFTFLLCASCFLQKVSCYCTSGRKTWEEGDWRDTIQQQAIFTGSEGENVPEVVLKKWEVMVCQSLHVVFIILSTLISYFESLEFFFVFFAIPACTSLLDPHMSASSLSNYTQPQCCSCINTIPLYRF